MLKPRDGKMNYKDIEELMWEYMFVSSCLSQEQYDVLLARWHEQGGQIPWWKFIMENVKLDI